MDFVNVMMTAVVGALTGAGAALLKNRIDYHHAIRSDLWNKRYESYRHIWLMTQKVARWPRNQTLSYKGLFELSRNYQNWYFEDGGILLSESGRTAYGRMQELITGIRARRQADQSDVTVDDSDYDLVLSACSDFRSALTKELLSRKVKQ